MTIVIPVWLLWTLGGLLLASPLIFAFLSLAFCNWLWTR